MEQQKHTPNPSGNHCNTWTPYLLHAKMNQQKKNKTDAPKQSNIQQTPTPNPNSNNNWPNQIKTMEQQKHTPNPSGNHCNTWTPYKLHVKMNQQKKNNTDAPKAIQHPADTSPKSKPLCKNSSFMIIVLVTGVCVPVFVFGAWVFGL
jgi:hypothetical protein